MADNVNTPFTGSGDSTATVRTKDRTGVETQVVALDLNPAGAETLMAGVMPVSDNGGSLTVDGTVAVSGLAGTSAVSIAAGSDVTTGNTSDAAVTTDTTGTLSGKLRGLVKWAFERMPAALGQTTMANSLPVTLASNQSALPITDNSGSLTVDAANTSAAMAAYAATDAVMAAGTALTPKFAFANVSASQTDSSIVSAVASKKIRVLAAYAVAGATATDLTFNTKPAGAGSAKTAKFANGANGGEILPFNPVGWFETASGEGLTVTTGAGSTTGIGVVYIEV